MSDHTLFSEEDTRRLIVAITDFLRDQLNIRENLLPEDRDCLEIAIQCLEMAYGLDPNGYIQLRFSRPLLDIFTQVTHPVTVADRLRADVLKDQGNDCMSRNMYQNAEAKYTAAIELDRWNSIYYCNRAGARIEQQNFFDAIADCRQALMLNPDYAKAYGRMGQAYALLNRPREAARCFRKALQLDPRNERYRNNLGVAESHLNQTDVLGMFSGMLSSIFGTGSQTAPRASRNIQRPPSFMILAERPIPVRGPSQINNQTAQDTRTESHVPVNPLHGSPLPSSFHANSTCCSDVQEDHPADAEDDDDVDADILITVPEYALLPDVVTTSPPRQKGYNFNANVAGPGGINQTTANLENHKITQMENHGNEADLSLGTKKDQPSVEKDAESSKLSSPENTERIATGPLKFVFGHVPSQSVHESMGIKRNEPETEELVKTDEPTIPGNNKNMTTDEPNDQDTDSKHIPSNTADEQSFLAKWPTNGEWNKFEEHDSRKNVANSSSMESPKVENNVALDSGVLNADAGTDGETDESGQSEIPATSPLKTIRSDSELFDTLQSFQASNVGESKEDSSNNLNENSKVTDEKESRDKPDDKN